MYNNEGTDISCINFTAHVILCWLRSFQGYNTICKTERQTFKTVQDTRMKPSDFEDTTCTICGQLLNQRVKFESLASPCIHLLLSCLWHAEIVVSVFLNGKEAVWHRGFLLKQDLCVGFCNIPFSTVNASSPSTFPHRMSHLPTFWLL